MTGARCPRNSSRVYLRQIRNHDQTSSNPSKCFPRLSLRPSASSEVFRIGRACAKLQSGAPLARTTLEGTLLGGSQAARILFKLRSLVSEVRYEAGKFQGFAPFGVGRADPAWTEALPPRDRAYPLRVAKFAEMMAGNVGSAASERRAALLHDDALTSDSEVSSKVAAIGSLSALLSTSRKR